MNGHAVGVSLAVAHAWRPSAGAISAVSTRWAGQNAVWWHQPRQASPPPEPASGNERRGQHPYPRQGIQPVDERGPPPKQLRRREVEDDTGKIQDAGQRQQACSGPTEHR